MDQPTSRRHTPEVQLAQLATRGLKHLGENARPCVGDGITWVEERKSQNESTPYEVRYREMDDNDDDNEEEEDDDDILSVTHRTGRGCATCSLATSEREQYVEPPLRRSYSLKTRDCEMMPQNGEMRRRRKN